MDIQQKRLEALKKAREARQAKTEQPVLESSVDYLTEEQKETLRKVSRYLPTALGTFRKAYSGNRPAAVKAKCIECCNLDKSEVRDCHISDCPLWKIRPYQQK